MPATILSFLVVNLEKYATVPQYSMVNKNLIERAGLLIDKYFINSTQKLNIKPVNILENSLISYQILSNNPIGEYTDDVCLIINQSIYAINQGICTIKAVANETNNYLKTEGFDKNEPKLPQGLDDQNKGNTVHTVISSDTKIILTGGRPLELERELANPIYFDQFGELTGRFNIAHVPAIVEQDGKYLKVTELNIDINKK